MAMVDNGVIIFNDGTWLHVRARCPYCGHMESDRMPEYVSIPKHQHERHYVSHVCTKCMKAYNITAYPG